jgi:hypothetical protein
MYSQDHPNEISVFRPGELTPRQAEVESSVKWADVLIGKALAEFMGGELPTAETMQRLRQRSRIPEIVSPGTIVEKPGTEKPKG